jgi:hypothetical protein
MHGSRRESTATLVRKVIYILRSTPGTAIGAVADLRIFNVAILQGTSSPSAMFLPYCISDLEYGL